jgi:hypothetical protein
MAIILFEVYQHSCLRDVGGKAKWQAIEIECRCKTTMHLRSAGLSSYSRSWNGEPSNAASVLNQTASVLFLVKN